MNENANPADVQILVVDDDPLLLRATARTLNLAGYATLEAATGEAGLRLAQAHQPAVVLLDVVLPDINGLEVCRRNKAASTSYVILISGLKTESEAQAAGLEAGADGYITRPIPNRELVARVRTMLRLKQAEDRLRRSEAQLRENAATLRILLDANPESIFLMDPQGAILAANSVTAQRLGKSLDQILGACVYDLLPPDVAHARRERVEQARRSRQPVRFEDTRAGRHIDNYVHPIVSENGQVSLFAITGADITERKQTEQELRRLYEQARQDAATKAALIEEINHRVRNNLSVIIGLLNMEREHLADMPNAAMYETIVDNMTARLQCLATVHSLFAAAEWKTAPLNDLIERVAPRRAPRRAASISRWRWWARRTRLCVWRRTSLIGWRWSSMN
jgi:hypothetical protein